MKHTAGFVTHRPLIIEETFPLSCPASELSRLPLINPQLTPADG